MKLVFIAQLNISDAVVRYINMFQRSNTIYRNRFKIKTNAVFKAEYNKVKRPSAHKTGIHSLNLSRPGSGSN